MTHETIYNMTALTVSRAERGDTGSYTVVIENPHGKVSATVKVQVIGELQSDLLPGKLLIWCQEKSRFFLVPSLVCVFRSGQVFTVNSYLRTEYIINNTSRDEYYEWQFDGNSYFIGVLFVKHLLCYIFHVPQNYRNKITFLSN